MVVIMPGMLTLAPDLTENNAGLEGSPNERPQTFPNFTTERPSPCLNSAFVNISSGARKGVSVVMTKYGGVFSANRSNDAFNPILHGEISWASGK